jgi:hypothetical protein
MFTADIAKSTADMAAASTHLAERLWFQRHARDCDRNEVEPCKKRFSTCKKTDQESILSKFKIARWRMVSESRHRCTDAVFLFSDKESSLFHVQIKQLQGQSAG